MVAEDEEEQDSQDQVMAVDDATVPHCRGAHLAALFIKTFFRTIRSFIGLRAKPPDGNDPKWIL